VLQPTVRDDSEGDVGEPSAGLSQQHIPKNAGAQLTKVIGLYSRPAPKRKIRVCSPPRRKEEMVIRKVRGRVRRAKVKATVRIKGR